MATQRYISTSLWTDEWFLDECTVLQRDGFVYLLTNPSTSIAGVYQLSSRHMAADLTTKDRQVTVEEVKELFQFYEEHGKAYLRKGWVILPSWPRHQRLGERGTVRQGLVSLMRGIPPWLKSLIISEKIPYQFPLNEIWEDAEDEPIDHGGSIDRPPIDHGGSIDRRRYDSDSDSDSDSDTDLDSDSRKTPSAETDKPSLENKVIDLPEKNGSESKKVTRNKDSPKVLSPLKDNLANYYQELFISQFPHEAWDSYAKERKQLNTIAGKTKNIIDKTPYDDLQQAAREIIKTYLDLKKFGKTDYWRSAPVTPSGLSTRWSNVWDKLASEHEHRAQSDIDISEIAEMF